MSSARTLQRVTNQRAIKLWRKLRRKGHKDGLACLTCGTWLSEPLDDEDARAEVGRLHRVRCPKTMISFLDLRGVPPAKTFHENVARP